MSQNIMFRLSRCILRCRICNPAHNTQNQQPTTYNFRYPHLKHINIAFSALANLQLAEKSNICISTTKIAPKKAQETRSRNHRAATHLSVSSYLSGTYLHTEYIDKILLRTPNPTAEIGLVNESFRTTLHTYIRYSTVHSKSTRLVSLHW
jgi:hypothetical protein